MMWIVSGKNEYPNCTKIVSEQLENEKKKGLYVRLPVMFGGGPRLILYPLNLEIGTSTGRRTDNSYTICEDADPH